jgi:hypothetical protein
MTRGTKRAFAGSGWRHGSPAAAAFAFLLLAGCSGGGAPVTTASTSPAPPASTSTSPAPPASTSAGAAQPPAPAAPSTPSLKDKIANFFSSATQREPQPVTNAQPNVECPFLDIRQGASTLTFPPPPPDGSNEAMSLKYQGIFVRAARDCAVVNGQMVMRVGVQGRIIVGPAGGAGHLDVPLRIAVVSAPITAPKTVITRLIRIPVTIGANDANVDFTHIEEGLSFAMPSSSSDPYIVYIGFDPFGAAAADQAKKPAPAKKPKPSAKPNPNAPTG